MKELYFNIYVDMGVTKQKRMFDIGDKVRISKYKRKTFFKGYTPNWTEKMFVDQIQSAIPVTYKLKDLNNEEIKGSFYEE